ncbi:uncharacterized protein N7503_002988 [Penicillium pulvis]|uniref:uncharacterized protein n=1 Tax=Penicillium pulvis TaxID=1562058 RepID=UPI0025470278|nr:uncharacterized protein N7503_002988 [Penicillium pulvis]KAJ5805386.1 hypothetical protein N7503_002988 [Penicillium pulvis]
MGLIRDLIGAGLGSDQVNNGFNGPKLPFANKINRTSLSPSSRQKLVSDARYQDERRPYSPDDMQRGMIRQQRYIGDQDRAPVLPPRYEPPAYESGPREWYQGQSYDGQPCDGQQYYKRRAVTDMRCPRDAKFRPIALPQLSYGDGQPFLRGYSNDLVRYGISEGEFIRLVDAINVAIIPNPENQIFQKGANIAGWFIPGAASVALTVGQIGIGIGAAAGHASMVAKHLSKANLDLFLPSGLEICIGKTKDVDEVLGLCSSTARPQSLHSVSPEERRAQYGDLVAPLSRVLSPLEQRGRSDPIAMLGRGIASRGDQKKMQKVQKELSKGRGKTKNLDALEGGLKWLIVREASANAVAHWEQTLDQSNAALQQEARVAEQRR